MLRVEIRPRPISGPASRLAPLEIWTNQSSFTITDAAPKDKGWCHPQGRAPARWGLLTWEQQGTSVMEAGLKRGCATINETCLQNDWTKNRPIPSVASWYIYRPILFIFLLLLLYTYIFDDIYINPCQTIDVPRWSFWTVFLYISYLFPIYFSKFHLEKPKVKIIGT